MSILLPKPRTKVQAFNPFISSDMNDLVFSFTSNNGRYFNDEYANYIYDERKFNVFKTSDYKDTSFCWHENYILSISLDYLQIIDILFGLEEGQIFVVPCCIMNESFKKIFNQDNILIGRYINNEKLLEIIEINKNYDLWQIDEKYKGKSKKIPTNILFDEFYRDK